MPDPTPETLGTPTATAADNADGRANVPTTDTTSGHAGADGANSATTDLNQANSIIRSDEKRKAAIATARALGIEPVSVNGRVSLSKTLEAVAAHVNGLKSSAQAATVADDAFAQQKAAWERDLADARKAADDARRTATEFVLKGQLSQALGKAKVIPEATDDAVRGFLESHEIVDDGDRTYFKTRDGQIVLNDRRDVATMEEAAAKFLATRSWFQQASARASVTSNGTAAPGVQTVAAAGVINAPLEDIVSGKTVIR